MTNHQETNENQNEPSTEQSPVSIYL